MSKSSSARRRRSPTFCLDANLSYKIAEAMKLIELPIIHVSRIPGFRGAVTGQSPVEDEVIAKWCATTKTVLVTQDEDFTTRWVRSGLLAQHGAEVIVYGYELLGLEVQHRTMVTHYPLWVARLEPLDYRHRVWQQGRRGSPTEMKSARRHRSGSK